MTTAHPFRPGVSIKSIIPEHHLCYIRPNKTRQGYARKRILKPAGSFFLGGKA